MTDMTDLERACINAATVADEVLFHGLTPDERLAIVRAIIATVREQATSDAAVEAAYTYLNDNLVTNYVTPKHMRAAILAALG